MKKVLLAVTITGVLAFGLLLFLGKDAVGDSAGELSYKTSDTTRMNANPVVYFEIPVTDVTRAKRFYTAVFGFDFTDEVIDHNTMALFPFFEAGTGITGALAQGEIYKPSHNGTLVYFGVTNIDEVLKKVQRAGGKTLYPKTAIGSNGFVAEFEDSEGNRVALNER